MTSLNNHVTLLLLVGTGAVSMVLTWMGTSLVRSHAIRNAMFDVPNQRSSHALPTPRGGGAAIVGVALIATLAATLAGALPLNVFAAILGGGFLVALAGWIDDRYSLSAGRRAAVHLIAAAWSVACLGGPGQIRIGALGTVPDVVAYAGAVLTIVWMTNLYNFMDGIDGLAATETITVGFGGAIILMASGVGGLSVVSAALAGAGAGFLIWNRMPARIFMGDVGSGFIGFMFATVAVAAHRAAQIPLTVWILLLLVFIFDSTATLIRRIIRGQTWHLAHRLHGYQRLVQSGFSHTEVVGAITVINVLLVLLAITVVEWQQSPWPILIGGLLVGTSYVAIEYRKGMWT